MSLRLRIRNASTLAVTRLKEEFKRLRARINTQEGGNLSDILQSLYKLTDKVLKRSGDVSFDPHMLVKDADPDPEKWNQNMEQVHTDLKALFSEDKEIKRLRAEVYNSSVIASKELQERNNLAASMITDLRLTAGQLDQDVIVAGDDFSNMDHIEVGFPLTYSMADINILQGVATLRRVEAVNVVDPEAVKITISPLSPAAATNRAPTPDNSNRFYEGKFYAPVGEARPEGGKWHLEERVRPGTVVPYEDSGVYAIQVKEGMSDEELFSGFPDLKRESDTRETGFPLSPEDILVIDRGASLEELSSVRKKMVDGNPETFWECEFVLSTSKLDELAAKLLDPVSPTDPNNPSGSSEDPNEGGDPSGTQVAQITPEDLRARASESDIDTVDFEVEITMNLPRRETINFITINPINFGETTWLEVTDVALAGDEDDGFITIEGFGNSTFDNILTNEANMELTEGEQSVTLSPNRYSYRGLGVFTFPPTEASKVRIRLMQRVPVPSAYERLSVQLNRTLTTTTSKVKQSGGGM
jgi:hypothetical protein